MPLVSRIRRRTALAVSLTRFEQHILPCVGETRGIQCPLNRPFYRKCRGFRAYLEGNSDPRGSFGALQDTIHAMIGEVRGRRIVVENGALIKGTVEVVR
jgi:hypothetical protein